MPNGLISPTKIGRGRTLSAVVALALGSGVAMADDAPPPPESGRELGLFPLIGGDTDNGFGVGAIGSIAEFAPDNPVYLWKLDFAGFYATKGIVPTPSYIDASTTLTIPQMLHDHLRIELRPSFTLDNALPFYGFGNKPPVQETTYAPRDFYERLHPAISLNARWRLSKHWFLLEGIQLTYNKISASPDSTLAREITDPHLMDGHLVLRLEAGFAYDTRDNEVAPSSGQWHQIKVRASPNWGDAFPYEYAQYDAIARAYFTLIPRTLVLAIRGVIDIQTGNVPFYEESRYEETSAIGGGQGVRGVPAYSFYGRVKAFGNLELRAKLWRFEALSRKFNFGLAGFFDAGRLWADQGPSTPTLDGTGLGLHYGIGGGIRLQQGRAFLVRADVAWSPDAKPIGAYLMADQAF